MIQDMKTTLTRMFTVVMLIMVSMVAQADVKVLFGEDGKELEPGKNGTITLSQKEVTGGTITITQEKPTDGKVRVNFNVAPASGYTYTDGNITLVAFYPLSSTRADSPAEDITVHSTLTLTPKDESQTDTSKPRDYYVDIDEGLGLWVQKASFISGAKGGSYREIETYYYIANSVGYNANTPAKNFYLLPATNSNYAVGQPHLTTAKSGKVLNCCWQIEESGDYYRIIHVSDGKYLTANEKYSGTTNDNVGRLRVHLQTFETPDDNTLFQRIENNNGGYNIRHIYMTDKINKSTTTYLDPAGGNIDNTDLTNARTITVGAMTINVGGGIGYWTDEPAARWNFEVVTKCPKSDIDLTDIELTDPSGEVSIYNLPGSYIYYTLTGENPVVPSEGAPEAPTFLYDSNNKPTISGTTTIKAIAVKDGLENSDIATTTIIKVETPTLTYDKGTVIIDCATEGATIYYTTDNTAPTADSTPYTDAITLTEHSTIVKAIAVKDGCIPSDVGTLEAVLKCEKPVIAKVGHTFTITCPYPADADIFYAIGDGELETTYNDAVSFTDSDLPFRIRAIAKKTNHDDSEIGSKYFGLDISGSGTSESPYLIRNADDFEVFVDWLNEDSEKRGKYFKIEKNNSNNGLINLSGCSSINSEVVFTGTLDGDMVTLSGLGHPLFNTIGGSATVKNVILDDVSISSGTSFTVSGDDKTAIGAIACVAKETTRIYNCGILATTSTVKTDDDGYTEITSCSSSVGGTADYVGGLVGFLDGSSRVINCFSYAEIKNGSSVGGIVGWNNVATNANSEDDDHYLKTMVMNCMFYGDITGGSSKAPIYNGEIITNDGDANGVNNFNYFWAGASYVQNKQIDPEKYNCALSAETRFLQRFEFFRHLLNSNRELAAWWATGSNDKNKMMKWVMEPSQIGSTTPYPILKAPGRYKSMVYIDDLQINETTHKGSSNSTGTKLDDLSVTVQLGSNGDGDDCPENASIINSSLTLDILDKDSKHFNFNYYKVQLPYYNDVGTKNYTDNKVVTGWKIVKINGSETGTGSFTPGSDASASVDDNDDITLTTPYNFADRKNTNKDLYSVSGRVFNQGAYFDVPEGVSSITIEPYWGKCVYVADNYLDVVYKNGGTNNSDPMFTPSSVTTVGGDARGETIDINGVSNTLYTSMSSAVSALNPSSTSKVYDNAIVLVGNVHSTSLSSEEKDKPFTIMSIDLDEDNEPDYSYILRFNDRTRVHPVRIDFLNVIGLGMAQKSKGGQGSYNFGILQPYGWFECTNTGLFRVTQFEYDPKDSKTSGSARDNSPMILQGGVIEQWVTIGGSEDRYKEAESVIYYHVGGNVWFKEFHIGVHQDKNLKANNNPNPDQFISRHPPISVTGGDFVEFYLTGLYNTPNNSYDDDAECYINGGRFGKVSGTGVQGIGVAGKTPPAKDTGNIIWQIDNADIDEFYAGGINAAHRAVGNIYTLISNSRVDQFCGGPKFGDMNSDKKVVTNAKKCTFRTFFGAGYGGNSYNRRYPTNKYTQYDYEWNSWLGTEYTKKYDANYNGVETRIDYQFIPKSDNEKNVGRLFVDYVSFSLAKSFDVTSKLTGCTITKAKLGRLDISDDDGRLGNFFGGGSLGKVAGPVKSTLINCTVKGNVYGAGYSATLPKVSVMDQSFQTPPRYDTDLGAFMEADPPSTTPYTWEHASEVNSTDNAINTSTLKLFTEENLDKSNLGSVSGAVTLTLTSDDGETVIGTVGDTSTGNVYGGGDESYVYNESTPANAYTEVNLSGNTTVLGSVFGGGNRGLVSGNATVNIKP